MSEGLTPEQKDQLVVVGGHTHLELSGDIATAMGLELGQIELRDHPDTQPYARFDESVRGKHVIAIQTHGAVDGKSVPDSFLQHMSMIDAARLASAGRITALSPNFAGTRQERQTKPRETVSLDLNLRIARLAGATDLVTVDPHSPVTRFEGTSTVLTAQTLLRAALSESVNISPEDFVVVSPDQGHSTQSQVHADALGLGPVVTIQKLRDPEDSTKIIRPETIEGVEGLTCLILDDMIDTAGTLTSAAHTLHKSGATAVYAAATHGFFSNPGLERLESSPIDRIFITDTLPVGRAKSGLGDRLQVVSVADMIADSMERIIQGRSVSETAAGQSYN